MGIKVDGVNIPGYLPSPGVAKGGTTGQILAKNSNNNYDTHWITMPTYSNKNILDNWYFISPVNQQGKTSYTSTDICIDRWWIWSATAGTATAQITTTGLQILRGTALCELVQNIELNNFPLNTPLTFSVLTDKGLFTATGTINITSTNSVKTNTSFGFIAFRFLENDNYCSVIIHVENEDVEVQAVKLEIGTTQTLAKQNISGEWVLIDAPPNRAEEYFKCLKYMVVQTLHKITCPARNTYINLNIEFPTTMYKQPTVSLQTWTRDRGYITTWPDATAAIPSVVPTSDISRKGFYLLQSSTGSYYYTAGTVYMFLYSAYANL